MATMFCHHKVHTFNTTVHFGQVKVIRYIWVEDVLNVPVDCLSKP